MVRLYYLSISLVDEDGYEEKIFDIPQYAMVWAGSKLTYLVEIATAWILGIGESNYHYIKVMCGPL